MACTAKRQTSLATSEAKSFAMAASGPKFSWLSSARAARQVISRAASILVCISAILNWVFWKELMGLPNCLRSLPYLMASFSAPWAMPTAWAAMPMRPQSSAPMAILKPRPTGPSTRSGVTRTWS